MGFILCIFSLLYYAAVYIGAEKRKDPLCRSGIKFAGASLLSAAGAAVILIPAVFAVSETTAAKQAGFSLTANTYGNLWEQLSRLLFDAFPYATSADQASLNIYCGCAALLFLGLYFFNTRISWRKKAVMAGLLLFYFSGFHFAALEVLNLDGMTGIFITKGNHEVEFSYRVSGLRAGAAGSVLTLGIIGLSLWMESVRKSKRRRGRSNEKEPHLFTDRDMGR